MASIPFILNKCEKPGSGALVAFLANTFEEEYTGVGIAGLVNKIEWDYKGVNIAGFGNYNGGYYNGGDYNGIRIAGFVNIGDNFNGIEATGLVNKNGGKSKGAQISCINYSKGVDDFLLQFGLFNHIGEMDLEKEATIQIGLYNSANGAASILLNARGIKNYIKRVKERCQKKKN